MRCACPIAKDPGPFSRGGQDDVGAAVGNKVEPDCTLQGNPRFLRSTRVDGQPGVDVEISLYQALTHLLCSRDLGGPSRSMPSCCGSATCPFRPHKHRLDDTLSKAGRET